MRGQLVGKKMFGKLVVLAVGALLVASCSKKNVKPDGEAGEAGQGGNSAVVSDKAINFDAQGSDSGKIVGLNTINFDYDKSALSADAKKKLSENAQWIKSNGTTTVQIEGHTDERGSIEYNLALGERRAKSVRQYLISLGVDGKRMKTISYGKEKPLVSGDNEAAYAKNRRANFVPLSE
jgi:peptidoglycan-associated lipoprotein